MHYLIITRSFIKQTNIVLLRKNHQRNHSKNSEIEHKIGKLDQNHQNFVDYGVSEFGHKPA